jgi:hypothetical protein
MIDYSKPPTDCPVCEGEREWSGVPGMAQCHFCGASGAATNRPQATVKGYQDIEQMKKDFPPSTTFYIARPLVENIPQMEGEIVQCPLCGRPCWKRPLEPDPLPPNTMGVCTSCALKQGMNPARPIR